mmetsp:Transcript_6642/g.9200  ORF Transcript_6642/g.9200 Transcript_6642/m.9200 type:complete len:200 (+) Transcript_6642:119-718(+)
MSKVGAASYSFVVVDHNNFYFHTSCYTTSKKKHTHTHSSFLQDVLAVVGSALPAVQSKLFLLLLQKARWSSCPTNNATTFSFYRRLSPCCPLPAAWIGASPGRPPCGPPFPPWPGPWPAPPPRALPAAWPGGPSRRWRAGRRPGSPPRSAPAARSRSAASRRGRCRGPSLHLRTHNHCGSRNGQSRPLTWKARPAPIQI